jgi:hypothetical protein
MSSLDHGGVIKFGAVALVFSISTLLQKRGASRKKAEHTEK